MMFVRGQGADFATIPRTIDDETVDLTLAAAEKIGWNFVEDVNARTSSRSVSPRPP